MRSRSCFNSLHGAHEDGSKAGGYYSDDLETEDESDA